MTPPTSYTQRLNAELVMRSDPKGPEYIEDEEEIEDTRVNGKFLRVIEYMNRRGYGSK